MKVIHHVLVSGLMLTALGQHTYAMDKEEEQKQAKSQQHTVANSDSVAPTDVNDATLPAHIVIAAVVHSKDEEVSKAKAAETAQQALDAEKAKEQEATKAKLEQAAKDQEAAAQRELALKVESEFKAKAEKEESDRQAEQEASRLKAEAESESKAKAAETAQQALDAEKVKEQEVAKNVEIPTEVDVVPEAIAATVESAIASDFRPVSSVDTKSLVPVSFTVRNTKTKFGQDVYVIGNTAELGRWDPAKAIKMFCTDIDPTWNVIVPHAAGQTITYKYIKRPNDSVWMNGSDLSFTVSPETASVQQLQDMWR